MCKFGSPRAYKDNFWNTERVRRNLTFKDVADHIGFSESYVADWFCGRKIPPVDGIEQLCDWFTELDREYPIAYSLGKMQFQAMYEEYIAESNRKMVISGEKTEVHTMPGRKASTRIGQLVRENGLTYQDIADKVHVTVSAVKGWMQGICRPSDDIISEIADMLSMPIDIVDKLFDDAYKSKHNKEPKHIIDNQIGFEEITSTTAKKRVISKDDIDYVEYHCVDPNEVQGVSLKEAKETLDQGIAKSENPVEEPFVVIEPDGSVFDYASKPYYDEYPSKEESDNIYPEGQRFTKWFNLFNTSLEDRKDIVAHLMYLYTQCDYNMYATIEALVYERNDIPFWVLRKIIIESEKVNYFGESNEGGKNNG